MVHMCKLSRSVNQTSAYWVVPRGRWMRHAITVSPCAHAANSAVKAVCGVAVTLPLPLPLPTPNDRVPKTRSVTTRCPECTAAVGQLDVRDVVWDS